MTNTDSLTIPEEITQQLWTRYLPETTYKMLGLVGYLQANGIVGEQATQTLIDSNIEVENNIAKLIEDKKKILASIGFEYPENRKDDIELLLKFKLIEKNINENDQVVYKYSEVIKDPAQVLNLDQEEKKILENIKFEMEHEQALNMILSLILTNNGVLTCSIEHIIKTTKVKLTEIKEVLDYLVNNEGSVIITADKSIKKLKKQDKVYIKLNEKVFNEKRFVV